MDTHFQQVHYVRSTIPIKMVWPKRHADLSFKAPMNVEVVSATINAATIQAYPPTGNTAIDTYEAFIQGGSPTQSCSVAAASDPLQCEITDLASATAYTVSLRACMPAMAGCGSTVQTDLTTPPLGECVAYVIEGISSSPSHFLRFQLHTASQ